MTKLGIKEIGLILSITTVVTVLKKAGIAVRCIKN